MFDLLRVTDEQFLFARVPLLFKFIPFSNGGLLVFVLLCSERVAAVDFGLRSRLFKLLTMFAV